MKLKSSEYERGVFQLLIGNVEVETKRTLGMVIIRGENILTLSAEAPPH